MSAQFLGIRRQAHDHAQGSISLRRIVEEVLTRFLASETTTLDQLGEWHEWANRRSRLVDASDTVVHWANKRLAHRTVKEPPGVAHGAVNGAVDAVITVNREISEVFTGNIIDLSDLEFGDGWKTVLDRVIFPPPWES
ncbi:MAG: hypothetical protein GY929_26495 [Actinomycetia bacterium]|nr:hypothetical protein [Actinomycetes bacterium]